MARVSFMDTTLLSVLVIGFSLLGVADADRTVPAECPKSDLGSDTVKIPHETSSTKYYLCVNGKKVLMECPVTDDGIKLVFDSQVQACDWPFNVNSGLPLPGIESLESKATIPTKCPRVESKNKTVHLAHEKDCTKFYKCNYGRKILMQCPAYGDNERLYFNPSAQVCDWPWNVDCKLPLPSLLLSLSSLKYPTECPKIDWLNETVQLPHETDCTKFYMCSGGKKHLMECPFLNGDGDKLYFNSKIHICDWPQNVDCKLPLPKIRIESLALKAAIPTKCPRVESKNETVHLAHEKDCTKFYKCDYGRKILMQCPAYGDNERLYFNPSAQVCDWPWNVDCKLPLPSLLLSLSSLKYPTQCPKIDWLNETVQLPHETDCTKFYACRGGKKNLMECPFLNDEGDKLYFNPKIHVCDWPQNVDCEQPLPCTRVATFAKKVPVIPTKCPKHDSENITVHLSYEKDCTKFYKCSHGKKILMDCPAYNADGDKLYFDVAKQVCDWPWNVDCKSIPTPPITSTSSTAANTPTPSSTTEPSTPTPPSTTEPSTPTPSSTTEPSTPTPSSTTEPSTPTPSSTTEPSTPTPSSTTEPSTPTPSSTTEPSTPTPPSTTEPSTPSTTPPSGVEGCLGTCPNHDPPNKITALPHANCRKWCRCENNVPKVFDCPGDFHFSPTLKTCTKPELAGCKNKNPYGSGAIDQHDEALMNILGYNERFLW